MAFWIGMGREDLVGKALMITFLALALSGVGRAELISRNSMLEGFNDSGGIPVEHGVKYCIRHVNSCNAYELNGETLKDSIISANQVFLFPESNCWASYRDDSGVKQAKGRYRVVGGALG